METLLGHISSAVYCNTEVGCVQNGWLIVVTLLNLLLSFTQQDPSLRSRICRSEGKFYCCAKISPTYRDIGGRMSRDWSQ